MLEQIRGFFDQGVGYAILFLEITGAVLILINAVQALIFLIKGNKRQSREEMAEGITLGLSFLLGSEVLNTIVAPDWQEIGMTCAILVMRAGINLLLYYERKMEANKN